jgi:hypothetical protein
MYALTKILRFVVGACISLVLLYCGIGMIVGIVLGRVLPSFPFSWVDWLNRPNLPPLLDHVINFIVTSMVGAVFQSTGRQRAPASGARKSSAF